MSFKAVLGMAVLLWPTIVMAAPPAVICVNQGVNEVPGLAAAVKDGGMTLVAGKADDTPKGPLVVWKATAEQASDITPARAALLEDYVRQGGSLYLSLDRDTGVGPMRLAVLLPTTAWETQIENGHRGGAEGPIQAGGADPDLFPGVDAKDVGLSYYYRIRPFDAVERGEARYERYARTEPFIDLEVKPDNTFWTRSLINRDWRVRLWGSDVGHSPILVTGRYGAGRVAILAGSLADLDRTASGKSVESAVFKWLTARDEADPPEPDGATVTADTVVDIPSRKLHVTLHNTSPAPVPVQLVARILTWEPALIGDETQAVTVPATGQATIDLRLPAIDPTSYQALAAKDVYDVRLGVLSQNGARRLIETRLTADLRPAVTVSVATDNIAAVPAPFHAPDAALQAIRMGMPVHAYVYKPGGTIQATVTVANGVRNLSALAQVRDETRPENPSVTALTDGAAEAGKTPIDKIDAYGMWQGQAGAENVLRLTFPRPMTISAVTLIGVPASDSRNVRHNPGSVIVEADGNAVAAAPDLDARWAEGSGRVHLSFAPVTATVVRLRLPYVSAAPDGKRRDAPWLGEVAIDGAESPGPPVSGTVSLVLQDALSGWKSESATQSVTVASTTSQTLTFPVTLPEGSDMRFLRLEARFSGGSAAATGSAPIMVLQPTHTLLPETDARPTDGAYIGFIVTRGFRNAFPIGTGTQETHGAWEEPDDLVWAYSRRFKQTGPTARTQADRLYVTDADFRHYSTPWDTFVNGEPFFPIVAPNFVQLAEQRSSQWKMSDIVGFGFGDRWDSGPSVGNLYNWQDFIEFDEYLRAQGKAGLKGRTRAALAAEIDQQYAGPWEHWLLLRYVSDVDAMRSAFAAVGKRLNIEAQGIPLVPISQQADLAKTIRGESDDSTWGMSQENVPLTTGREMSILSFNPGWQLSTLLQWGWNSSILNQSFHVPIGTTEPTRRHYYDRAWRGIIGMDGTYRSMHTFGYNRNGGEAFTMTDNDYQQWWNLQERHSLIYPDAPLGVGLVLSTARLEDPNHTMFSGGGMGGSSADTEIMGIANTVRSLHEAGVSVPFTANAAVLAHWTGSAPLLILNLSAFSADEITTLKALAARGVRLAAFAGDAPLPAEAAALFAQPGALLIPGTYAEFTAAKAASIAPKLHEALHLPITYPDGTAGYGFTMQGKSFIEIEDWKEEGRVVSVRLRAKDDAKSATACDVNDHRTLTVRRDGSDWVINLPLRPGDGDVICVDER